MPPAMAISSRTAGQKNGPVPDIGIGKLLRRAHMAFSRELQLRLAAHGMTFGEFIHLEKLWDQDGLNQTDLSRRVGIATASSTKIIEALERRELIRRERDQEDRRSINVFLTAAGASLKDDLLACARTLNDIARQELRPDEAVMLFDLLGRIVGNLETLSSKKTARRRSGEGSTRS